LRRRLAGTSSLIIRQKPPKPLAEAEHCAMVVNPQFSLPVLLTTHHAPLAATARGVAEANAASITAESRPAATAPRTNILFMALSISGMDHDGPHEMDHAGRGGRV
jgi:hypothetical protein